ncbi:carbohydrate-binding family 9-like protein [Sunxiuqinia elliptica]|uniref:Cellulose/xylan binding protein with CBM9 domain n=1 Tax=Sunxiuqinia elliptica TaxID=655355 RepID=A0A4R6GWX9_9BACT|nr:carbohydrate-binding family 9-like protein [Sunxiuqinia elliptica]TDO00040.1 cellulose/xylan binding protein with CBM9 domain [Sunxiuqinia elliptica]TDO57231.1 cellulose/xylan binding protein with CBM9 domain [Sunxiuqinia elliptica]
MKLEISRLETPVSGPEAIAQVLKEQAATPLAFAPWGKPDTIHDVNFKIAHNDTHILLHYTVREDEILARYSRHNEPVYTDSCVEFFIVFDGEENYYNFEFNSLGTCLSANGPDREKRTPQSIEQLSKIKTQTKIQRLNGQESPRFEWQLSIQLPIELFGNSQLSKLSGKKARANFYKCGDDLSKPHFLSWNNIETPQPDFHQPPYFGEVVFL